MRFTIWMLALTSALCSPAAFAIDKATVDMPFRFESHGKIFPAGKYDVELTGNRACLTIVSRTDPTVRSVWVATPADFGPNDTALEIQFDRINNMAELHAVRLGSYTTPVLDPHSRIPLKNLSVAQVIR
jgi:hypothetical protein